MVAVLERKSMTSPAMPAAGQPEEGVVEAIVSVTGVVDLDNDIIEPGAFTKTLKKMRPKVVSHHNLKEPVGKVLEIEELMPGDPRLPTHTKDGLPWPAEAGALRVLIQFNLATAEGRRAYQDVKFYSATAEAEYSIGYAVPPGKARKDRSGVQRISEVMLVEVSPVLFGANSLSGTLSVKAAAPDYSGSVMLALYPPSEVAQRLAVPDGLDPEDLHVTVAYLGKASEIDADLVEQLAEELAAAGPIRAQISGIARFNSETGEEDVAVALVDSPDLEELRRRVVDALDAAGVQWPRNHGYTPHMTLTYLGEAEEFDPALTVHRPPEPVEFDFVAAVHGDDRVDVPFTGDLPDGPGEPVETGEGDAATSGSKAFPLASSPSGGGEGAPMGSWEERRDVLRGALEEFFLDPSPGGDDDGGGASVWTYLEINGTWDDHVLVTRFQAGMRAPESYEVYYAVGSNGQVEIGEVVRVRITVATVPVDGQDALGEASPLPGMLDAAAAVVKSHLSAGREVKAGRVLSGLNQRRLREAFQHLVDVLQAAGVTLPLGDGKEEKDDDEEREEIPLDGAGVEIDAALAGELDSTAPSARRPQEKALTVLKDVPDPRSYADSLAGFLAGL
ncbi:hypothetical protein GCM10022221_67450 [Actinocorallia aurea]